MMSSEETSGYAVGASVFSAKAAAVERPPGPTDMIGLHIPQTRVVHSHPAVTQHQRGSLLRGELVSRKDDRHYATHMVSISAVCSPQV